MDLPYIMKYIKVDLTKDLIPKNSHMLLSKWLSELLEHFNELELNLSESPSFFKN